MIIKDGLLHSQTPGASWFADQTPCAFVLVGVNIEDRYSASCCERLKNVPLSHRLVLAGSA